MSKYIIEIEDVPFSKVSFADTGAQNIKLYRARDFNALVFDKDGLDKLTSLDKELEEAYKRGLEEGKKLGADKAWKCARRLAWETSLNEAVHMGFIVTEDTVKILRDYTVTAAMKAVELYDEKQLKAEIKVGDEVEAYSGRAIVFGRFTRTDGTNGCIYWYPDKKRFDRDKVENLRKTGGYFPQVVKMFKALDGELQERNCSTCKHNNDAIGNICRRCAGYEKWEPKEVTE